MEPDDLDEAMFVGEGGVQFWEGDAYVMIGEESLNSSPSTSPASIIDIVIIGIVDCVLAERE